MSESDGPTSPLPSLAPGEPVASVALGWTGLGDLPLRVEVPLGTLEIELDDLLRLDPGSVLQLDRLTGESLDVTVNGTPIARGEVRVLDDRFGIRITEILHTGLRVSEEERASHGTPPEKR